MSEEFGGSEGGVLAESHLQEKHWDPDDQEHDEIDQEEDDAAKL